MIFSLITVLITIEADGRNSSAYVADCDSRLRAVQEIMPEADVLCVAPSYTMRPRARPADLMGGE